MGEKKMVIKLLKNGIRIDGKYFPCFYSSAKNNLNGNATIYIKTYEPLPQGAYKIFDVKNDTDIQTDYFERDSIRIPKNSEYFEQVEKLSQKQI